MLRITIIEATASLGTLKLEGRIAGTAVEELRRLSNELLAGHGYRRLILDLSDVSFIDNEGIELFHTLSHHNVVAANYSPFLAELLKEVVPCS